MLPVDHADYTTSTWQHELDPSCQVQIRNVSICPLEDLDREVGTSDLSTQQMVTYVWLLMKPPAAARQT